MTVKLAYVEALGGFDIAVVDGLLAVDEGLTSAVILSLFTDAYATTDELTAFGMPLDDHRGCWADGILDDEPGGVGSKLWLLSRALRNDESLAFGQVEAQRCLQWLVDDEIAERVTVSAAWWKSTGFMALDIRIYKPGELEPSWAAVWAATGESLE